MNDELDDEFKKLANSLIENRRTRQGVFVMRGAEILSGTLKEAITRKLSRAPPASGTRACPKAFKDRIDVARELGIITNEVHGELEKLREMRNRFAHATDSQNLEEGEMNQLFLTLKRPNYDQKPYIQAYMECVRAINDHVVEYLQTNFPD
jgi:hypothetical protein